MPLTHRNRRLRSLRPRRSRRSNSHHSSQYSTLHPSQYWSPRRLRRNRRRLQLNRPQLNRRQKIRAIVYWAKLWVHVQQTWGYAQRRLNHRLTHRLAHRVSPRGHKMGLEWSVGYGVLVVIMLLCVVFSPPVRTLFQMVRSPLGQFADSWQAPPLPSEDLFASVDALGVRAIGHAEGNLTAAGERTSLYWGHTDPGNFRRNQGWCSDQGRGGGDVDVADRKCLERVQARLDLLVGDLEAAGIDPNRDAIAFVNIVDLYNQASPWVSRQFPDKYAQALKAGKTGEIAIVWARVEAFRRRGRIDASGLIGICRRERRPVSDWDCVAHDQRRRARAIARVLE